ncbi:MAG: DUF4340 domain-containing protein, partial [Isosphaeraceae bacterium]
MNSRTQIVLLVLFFGGLLGYWWAESARVPTAERLRRESGLVLPELLEAKPGEVRRVEVSGGEEVLAFERDGDHWRMVQPLPTLADRSRLDTLVANLKDLRASREIGKVHGPAERFGLETPVRVVRLFGSDPKTPIATLDVGKGLDDHRYVRPSGRKDVEVVDSRLLAALDLPADDWRERSLFGVSAFDVRDLAVQGQGRDLKARRVEDAWRLVKPIQAPADDRKVEGLVADLTSLRVVQGPRGFVEIKAPDLKPYGLDPPGLTLTLTSLNAPDAPKTVEIGGPVPGETGRVYARRSDSREVLMIDGTALERIPGDPHALRSNQVVPLTVDRVDALRIKTKDVTYLLTRTPGGWKVQEPVSGQGDRTAITALLNQLHALQAIDLFNADQVRNSGLDQPTLTVEVWEHGSGDQGTSSWDTLPTFILEMGHHDLAKRTVYARTGGDPAILALPGTAFNLIPDGPLAYHDRVILTLDRHRIDRLKIDLDGKTTTLLGGGEDRNLGQWRLTTPVVAPADEDALTRMVVLLAGLRADGLIGKASTQADSFGFDAPWLRLSWGLRPDRGQTVAASAAPGYDGTLEVGALVPKRPGSRYARIEGSEVVFTLSPQALTILTAEPKDHVVLRFASEQVARLVLRWPRATVALVHKPRPFGEGTAWEPDPGYVAAGVDLDKLDTLTAMLSSLRTDRYVQYDGPFQAPWGLDRPDFSIEVQLSGGSGTRHLRLGSANPAG